MNNIRGVRFALTIISAICEKYTNISGCDENCPMMGDACCILDNLKPYDWPITEWLGNGSIEVSSDLMDVISKIIVDSDKTDGSLADYLKVLWFRGEISANKIKDVLKIELIEARNLIKSWEKER